MFRAMIAEESSHEESSLLKAIERHDSMETHRILTCIPSEVSMRDKEDRVALHYAAESMNIDTVKRILDNDTSLIDASDSFGYTPLVMAVQAGRLDVVELLLDRGASVKHVDDEGHSLIHWAVVCGQLDVMNLLLEKGADITVEDKNRATALHYATANDELPEDTATAILLTLIRRGGPVNARDMDERTPILWAAANGNVNALLTLKQAGGDILTKDRDSMTALHMAASNGSHEMVEKVLDIIPTNQIDDEDRSGCTPLFYAVAYGYYESGRILLTAHADPNHQDTRLRTPAHVAAAKGQLRMMKLLKQFGGSFEMQNYRGDLPLHEATQAGSKDVVEWLLALHPSSVNAPSHSGRTPLHIAAARGNIAVVIVLCGESAHVNPLMLYRDELLTPLDLAIRQDRQVVVDYLTMRQGALTAEQLPEDTRRESRVQLEEQIINAKLQYGRRMRGDEEDEVTGEKRKMRRARTTQDVNKERRTREKRETEGRAMSADEKSTRVVGRSTSTTDLKWIADPHAAEQLTEEDKRRKMLVEDRIEAIVREEMRAGRSNQPQGGGSDSRSSSKKRRREKRSEERQRGMEKSSEDEAAHNGTQRTSERSHRSSRSSERSDKDNIKKKSVSKNEAKRISEEESDGQGSVVDGSESEGTASRESNEKENRGREGKKRHNTLRQLVQHNSSHKQAASSNGKMTKMKAIVPYDEMDNDHVDIFEDEWEELDERRVTGKDATRRYLHEKAIFQELTHLKRMQIQYGKVQERILVHSLVSNFCKMHGLNPADYKFSSFYSWEKFLYEQLKLIYVDERERLTNGGLAGRSTSVARLNKFESRLRQARAIPLNDRIRELTRIYGSASMTGGKKVQKREQIFGGQKRCDCFGKHLLVKS